MLFPLVDAPVLVDNPGLPDSSPKPIKPVQPQSESGNISSALLNAKLQYLAADAKLSGFYPYIISDTSMANSQALDIYALRHQHRKPEAIDVPLMNADVILRLENDF